MTLSLVRDEHPGWEKLEHVDYDTAEWHTTRSLKLGGSEIAAVLGLSQWSSYYSVFCRKMGIDLGYDDNPAAEWGRREEPIIADKWAEDHFDLTLERSPGRYVRNDRRWQLASPDGIVGQDGFNVGILEIKTAMYADGWGRPGTFEVPPAYRAQVLWYLDVLNLRQAWVAVKIGSCDYREFHLDLDTDDEAAEDLALLLERGEQFIDRLKREDWPVPGDGSDVTYQAVRRVHPDIDPDADAEIDPELAGEYLAAEMDLAEAERRFTAARSLVLNQMGTAKYAVMAGDDRMVRFAYRTARTTKDGQPGIPFLSTDRKTKNRLTIKEAGEK